MNILIGVGIFIVVLLLLEGAYYAFVSMRNPEKKKVRARLRALSLGREYDNQGVDIVRKRLLSEVPWLNLFFSRFHWKQVIPFLEQSGTRHTLGFFILLSLFLASLGFLVGSWVTSSSLVLIPVMAFLGIVPFLYLHAKKKRRMQKFERQLPDAMELIARALKAGHDFSSGLKMVAEEFDDPIGTEFDKTLREINFGVGVAEALKNLPNLIDCPDLKFFVISVILQRESGGNLSEVLENIAHLVRERFKLHGRIRVLSAEGRFSAFILIALPFLLAFAILLLNPEYMRVLITDPIGKILIAFALLMMIVGIFVMKRMIEIKV